MIASVLSGVCIPTGILHIHSQRTHTARLVPHEVSTTSSKLSLCLTRRRIRSSVRPSTYTIFQFTHKTQHLKMASGNTGPSFPELLYVNSKIIKPDQLSPDLFTRWYNDVHIPDIFITSGIKEAYRYYTTSRDPSTVERPYLALYPIKFAGYLQSKEFASIPVKSGVLPGPNHEIFDVADFDTRYYRTTSASQPFQGQCVDS